MFMGRSYILNRTLFKIYASGYQVCFFLRCCTFQGSGLHVAMVTFTKEIRAKFQSLATISPKITLLAKASCTEYLTKSHFYLLL